MNVAALVMVVLRDVGLVAHHRLPQDAPRPIVRVEEAGGPPNNSQTVDRLTVADLQISAWGTTDVDARLTIETARNALHVLPRTGPAVEDLGVVVSTASTQPTWLPDVDWPDDNGRPGPRYVMATRVVAHPIP